MSDPKDHVRDILRKAYQIEVDGYTFYSMTADQATHPAVQELFEKLAKDEVEHKAYLKEIMKGVESKGAAAFALDRRTPDLKAFSDTIFTRKFREQAAGASFEMGVLSVGMTLENNAIRLFSESAAQSGEHEVKAFYQFLADWEKQHFDALQGLFSSVREDFWHAGGFAAF